MAFDDATYDEPFYGRGETSDAAGLGPREAQPVWRLTGIGVAGGLAALLLIFFWLDLRPDIEAATGQSFFWLKMVFTTVLGLAGFHGLGRLLRGRPPSLVVTSLALAAGLAFLIGGLADILRLEPTTLARAFSSGSIAACLFNVLALALPTLLLCLTLLRGVGCERPGLAGFAAGIFAGGLAASIYGLHCPHSTFVFVGLWYASGVLLSGVAGAAVARITAAS